MPAAASQPNGTVPDFKAALGVGALGGPSLLDEWDAEGDGIRIGVIGKEGAGKTDFALSAPGPVILFDVGEHNQKEVLRSLKQRHPEKEIILGGRYMVPPAGQKAEGEAIARKFIDDYHKMLDRLIKAKIAGTLVVDSATMLWELFKTGLAGVNEMGRAKNTFDYGPANAAYGAVFSQAKFYGQRLIVTARVDQAWENGAPTNRFDPSWQKHTGNHCDVVVEVAKVQGQPGADGKPTVTRLFTFNKATANKGVEFIHSATRFPDLSYEAMMGLLENF
jgi:hypothetical protein